MRGEERGDGRGHKVHIPRVPQFLSRPNWNSPPPLPLARVPPPPEPKGEGTHSSAGEGVGGSQFGQLEKKPSTLSTLLVRDRKRDGEMFYYTLTFHVAEF